MYSICVYIHNTTEYTAGILAKMSIWYTRLYKLVRCATTKQEDNCAQTNKQKGLGCDKLRKSRWCQTVGLFQSTGLTTFDTNKQHHAKRRRP